MDWKNFIYFALIPALIAGLSSIAPKLYEIYTEPKAELVFYQTNGLEIESPTNVQKVVSFEIVNSGKLPLTKISSDIKSDNGMIAAYKTQENTGLNPTVSHLKDNLHISLDKLFPNEHLIISVLVTGQNTGLISTFTLRSNEVLGTLKTNSLNKENNSSFSGSVLAMVSVLIMSIGFMTNSKFLGSYLYNHKQDMIFYIPIRFGMSEIVNDIRSKDLDLTYLRMADILLSYGLLSEENKSKSILALKSMLLIKDMAHTSEQIVVNNLKNLCGNSYSQKEVNSIRDKAVSARKLVEYRQLVDEISVSTDR